MMTFSDAIGLSLRNLLQSKLRTTLTTLGVSIGIASLAGMVSLGVGLQDQVVGRFMQSGLFGRITVTTQGDLPGALAQLGQRGLRRGRGTGSNSAQNMGPEAKLDDDAIKRISALPNVLEVTPNFRLPIEVALGEFSSPVIALGVPMSSRNEGPFQTFSYGEFFKSESENACLLTLDMAKRIVEKETGGLIGKSLNLSYAASQNNATSTTLNGFQVHRAGVQCRIAGIVQRNPGPLGPGGDLGISGVMLTMDLARTINADIVTSPQSLLRQPSETRTYGAVTVKVDHPQFTEDVENGIRRMGYQAFSIDDALRGAKNAFIILSIFNGLIGSIALAVSSLGIVNTMVMSILERTREIGIMKAIGASNNDIRSIFLVEATCIGLLGGLLGIALGWLVSRAINFGANIYIQNQGGTPGMLFSFPLWLIAGAILLSITVSLAAGSYPASRAARLDPIQALRHD
jgi:putative ABC transport system permease protein